LLCGTEHISDAVALDEDSLQGTSDHILLERYTPRRTTEPLVQDGVARQVADDFIPSNGGLIVWKNLKTGCLYMQIYSGPDVTVIAGPEYPESWYAEENIARSPAAEIRNATEPSNHARLDNWNGIDLTQFISRNTEVMKFLEPVKCVSWVTIIADVADVAKTIVKLDRTPVVSPLFWNLWQELADIEKYEPPAFRHNIYQRGGPREAELWKLTDRVLRFLTPEVVSAKLRLTFAGEGPPVDWIPAMLVTQGNKHCNRAALATAIAVGITAQGLLNAGLMLKKPVSRQSELSWRRNNRSSPKHFWSWRIIMRRGRLVCGSGDVAVSSHDSSMAAPSVYPIEILMVPSLAIVAVILLVTFRWHTGKVEEILQAAGMIIATLGLGLTLLVLKLFRTVEDVSDMIRGVKKLRRQWEYYTYLPNRPLTASFEENFSAIPFSDVGSCAMAEDSVRRTEAGTISKNTISLAALASQPDRQLQLAARGSIKFVRCDGSHAEVQCRCGKLSTHAENMIHSRPGLLTRSRCITLSPLEGCSYSEWYLNGKARYEIDPVSVGNATVAAK
jgi:hypothetical protein